MSLRKRTLTAGASVLAVMGTLASGCGSDVALVESEEPQLVEDRSVGVLEGDQSRVFGRISDIQGGDNGEFFVLDEQAGAVRRFDAAGRHLGSIAERGSGPGELRRPRTIHATSNQDLIVFDEASAGYAVYEIEGEELVFVRSIRPLPAEATLGRHVCSLGDRLYLRAAHDGSLVHEVDELGAMVQAFGPVVPASAADFGPAAPMVERVRNSGHLACLEDLQLVVSVGRYLPYVRAFTAEGDLVWELQVADLRLIGFAPGVGLNYDIDQDFGSHLGESVVRWDPNTVLVQYSTTWPDHVPRSERDRDHYRIASRLIDIETGTEVGRTDHLSLVVDGDGERFYGFRNLPYPQASVFLKPD